MNNFKNFRYNSYALKSFLIMKYFEKLTMLSLDHNLNIDDIKFINKVCDSICGGDK